MFSVLPLVKTAPAIPWPVGMRISRLADALGETRPEFVRLSS